MDDSTGRIIALLRDRVSAVMRDCNEGRLNDESFTEPLNFDLIVSSEPSSGLRNPKRDWFRCFTSPDSFRGYHYIRR